MTNYLKSHWYWLVGLLVGLYVLMRIAGSKASAGANITSPSGSAVIYGGTNANDAAIQVAQLNAQSTLAARQIDGTLAVEQAKIARDANETTQAASVEMTRIQGANALAISNGNNAAAVAISGNQTQLGMYTVSASRDVSLAQTSANRDVSLAQTSASRDVAITQATAKRDSDIAASEWAARLGMTQAQYAALVATTASDNQRIVALDTNTKNLTLGMDTNATNLALGRDANATELAKFGIQAQVINNQTTALRDIAITTSNNNAGVQTAYIDGQVQTSLADLEYQRGLAQMTYDLERSGVFNKGGAGGTNQVAAWNALINPASAAAGVTAAGAVAQTQASNSQIAQILSSIGSSLNAGLKTVFA